MEVNYEIENLPRNPRTPLTHQHRHMFVLEAPLYPRRFLDKGELLDLFKEADLITATDNGLTTASPRRARRTHSASINIMPIQIRSDGWTLS